MRRLSLVASVAALVLAPASPARAAPVDYVKPVRGPIVRHFEAPATPYGPGHRGIDIEAPAGSTVVASADGVVAFAGPVGGSLFASIDHPDGIRTTYSFLEAVAVRAGDRVRQGDPIARSGAGHPGVVPAHLHFGARVGSAYVDPEALLVASLQRNQWRAVRLAPHERRTAGTAQGRVLEPAARAARGGAGGYAPLAAGIAMRVARRLGARRSGR